MADSPNLISLLILILVFSLLANLYYLNGSISSIRKNKKDKKSEPIIVKKYLVDQSNKTTNSKVNQSIPSLHPIVVKFRSAYLMIEAKALDRGIDSSEYWNLINSKIKTLFDILMKFESNPTLKSIGRKVKSVKLLIEASEGITDKNNLTSCLDKFYKACVDNTNTGTLNRYDKKLNQLLIRFGDKNLSVVADMADAHERFSNGTNRAITKYELATQGLANTTENEGEINPSNKRVQQLIDDYKEKGEKIQDSLSAIRGNSSDADEVIARVVVASGKEGQNSQQSALELLEISESLQNKSEKEVAQLKKVVRDQREAIYSLENELTKMDKEVADSSNPEQDAATKSHYETQLSSLSGNLKDAENCIGVLESELENLQTQIRESRSLFEGDAVRAEISDLEALERIVKELEEAASKSSIELEFLRVFHEYCQEAGKLESLEDLAMHTYVSLSDLGYDSQFIVNGADREFVVSATGSIPVKIKTLLTNLSLNETSLSSNNSKIFNRQKFISCSVAKTDQKPIPNAIATQIIGLIQFADHLMKLITDAGQKKFVLRSLDKQSNNIKMKTRDIDGQLTSMVDTMHSSTTSTLKRIQDLARASGMSASHIARIRTYEQDLLGEIQDAKSINVKVKKAFLEILNDMEKIS